MPEQVPQLTVMPQLLTAWPQTRLPHAAALVCGVQVHDFWSAAHVRFGEVTQPAPQLTVVPQLLTAVPQTFEPQVVAKASAVQTHDIWSAAHVSFGDVAHEPQLTT